MTAIIGIMILSAMFGSAAWVSAENDLIKKAKKPKNKSYIIVVLAIGFIAHIIAAASYRGYTFDMNCFSGWADMAFENGISQFYQSDSFHDYPPGYIYVLYVLGGIRNLFSLDGAVWWVVLKMPSIIADTVMGYLAYKVCSEKSGKTVGSIVATFVVFNPTIILNTGIWGQVDSVLAIFSVLAIYYMSEGKFTRSFFSFAAALLIKPQAIFFAPVLVFGVIEATFKDGGFDKKQFLHILIRALAAIACIFILFMPFGNNPIQGIKTILAQYIETVGQYKYMTVNAFNIYGALGKNWADLTSAVSLVGYAMMIAVVVFAAVLFFKKKGKERYYIAAFVLVFGIFTVAPKMHERYAFPGIFMLAMLLAVCPKGKNCLFYGVFSLSQFFNIAWILMTNADDTSRWITEKTVPVASAVNVVIFIWMMYELYKTQKEENKSKTVRKSEIKMKKTVQTAICFKRSEKSVRIGAFDIAVMLAVTLIYGGVSFYKLGDKYAPQTETEFCQNSVTVDFGKEYEVANGAFYLGARNLDSNRNLTFEYLDGDKNIIKTNTIENGSVFVWTINPENVSARYVRIYSNCVENPSDFSDRVYVREICFLDSDENVIEPINATDKGVDMLFDEQDYLNTDKSYMSGTFFDEIYHPRTAYEFLNGMSVYEWTHPPLGKVLMGIGIAIFGMVPFGWRFIGTLFGVFMVPAVYLFARRCLKNKWVAVLACLIYTFDFMHFTQTRLATIDTYVTFFIILMYYYMYKYYKQSFYDTPLAKALIPLGLSGLFFGFSAASKWTGFYAGAGLAVIFFITLYERYKEYRYAVENPNGETDGISHKTVICTFKKNTIITLAFCCVMFVAVPFAIYALSYIPYMNTPSGNGFKTIFTNARDMLTYHGKTVVDSTHPYSSYWFEWPIIYRPLWYFSNTLDGGLKQGISAMGNPAVWWAGIPAVAYCTALVLTVSLKNKNYFGKDKKLFVAAYAAIFAVICLFAAVSSADNGNLQRLLPCMVFYSAVMITAFFMTITFDGKITQKSIRTPLFLLIGYFANYMPWMLVLRTTYIYHYFPCVIFAVLMISYSVKTFYENAKSKKTVIYTAVAYVVVVLGLFVLFYPVISGRTVSLEFAEKWLKWFESWVLVA